ncbi:MAG TPA: hypothetical protein VIH96_02575 [Paraburkholderia sp.]
MPAKLDETVSCAQVFYATRKRGHKGCSASGVPGAHNSETSAGGRCLTGSRRKRCAYRSRENEAVQTGKPRCGHQNPRAAAGSPQCAQLKNRKENGEHHPSALAASKADEMRKRSHSSRQACKMQMKWQSN